MAVTLHDRETRKATQFDTAAEASSAIQAGTHVAAKGQKFDVTLATGETGTVSGADLSQVIATGGSIQAPEDAKVAKAEARLEREGVPKWVAQASQLQMAGAQGATFGLAAPAMVKGAEALGGAAAGEKVRQSLNNMTEAFPVTTTTGEIGGAAAMALATGGLGGGARGAAGLAGRGLLRAGAAEAGEAGVALAERGFARAAVPTAERLIASGQSVTENALVRAGAAEARVTAQNAARMAGAEAADARVAARLMPQMAAPQETALQGLSRVSAPVANDISPAAQTLSRGAARPGVEAAANLAAEGVAATTKDSLLRGIGKLAAEGAAYGGAQGAGSTIEESVMQNVPLTAEKLAMNTLKGAALGGALGGGLGLAGKGLSLIGGKGGGISAIAEKQVVKDLKLTGKELTALEKIEGGAQGVIGHGIDNGVLKAGETFADAAPRAAENFAAKGEAVGALHKTIDAAGVGAPSIANIAKDVAAVQKGLASTPNMNRASIREVGRVLEDLHTATPETFEGLHNFRQQLDKNINWAMPTAKDKALMQVRDAIKKETLRAGEEVGGGFAQKLKTANVEYQQSKFLKDMAEGAAIKEARLNSVSLTESLSGGAGILGSLATGNPLPAIGGLALAATRKFARDKGVIALAVAMRKTGATGAIAQTATRVDKAMIAGVNGILAGSQTEKLAIKKAAGPTIQDKVQKIADKVANMQPPTDSTGHLGAVAPGVQAQANETMARTVAYLQDQLPKPMTQEGTPPGKDAMQSVNDIEAAAYLRKYEAATNPMGVLGKMKTGDISRESVDVIKNVYPEVHSTMKTIAMQNISDKMEQGKYVPYDAKLKLSLLMDGPTDWSLTPAGIAAIQGNISRATEERETAESENLSQGPARPIHLGQGKPTSQIDRIEAGE